MNQKKIGVFIAEKRKEKNMTQKDLAEKLNVSINAVSKWERGICLMDMSLLKPLSNILGVSVSEILNGDVIESNNNITNEILEKAIELSYEKIKTEKRKRNIIIGSIILCILIVGILLYKSALLYSIKKLEHNIHDNNYGKQEYKDKIFLIPKNVNDYYTFKNIKIENVFKDSTLIVDHRNQKTYKDSNGRTISLVLEKNNNFIDNYKDIDDIFINYNKYLEKYGIVSLENAFKFCSKFKLKKVSLLSSIYSLKNYYFETNFYASDGFTFDEFYLIEGIRNINSYVYTIESSNLIIYNIRTNDENYSIYFSHFDNIDETLEMFRSIKVIL